MPTFVPAARLNADFYADVLAQVLAPHPHAAALLGWGSDVLGYDTPVSTDHGWGPRIRIFVQPAGVQPIRTLVEAALPENYRGWPLRYSMDGQAPVRAHVEVSTLEVWLHEHLGADPRSWASPVDWLLVPQQLLLGVVRGAVYADTTGALADVRDRLRYFPDQVWRWLLACQWRRLAQEEHLIGRAAQAGDELGSRVAAARQVRELMRLAFLLERQYWPYTKWFGTAFAELAAAPALAPILGSALDARRYPEREDALCRAYELLAERHVALAITERVDPVVRPFHERPFRVLGAGRFADATRATVTDPVLRAAPPVGGVDQFADSTDVLSAASTVRRLRGLLAG